MNQHAPFLHPYDGMIPLSVAGYILGTVLLLAHLYALVKRHQVQAFLLASPRNHLLAQILLARRPVLVLSAGGSRRIGRAEPLSGGAGGI